MENNQQFDIIIVGAGLVGMSMALAVSGSGATIAVIEQGKISTQLQPEFDGRVSAIALGSRYILEHAGAWQHILLYAEPILDIRVTEGATPFFLHYDHKEVGDEPFGYIVENRFIRFGLHKAAQEIKNISLLENVKINEITQDAGSATIITSDGKNLQAGIIIAADGKKSQIRDMLGIKTIRWDYEQTAIVCTIEHSLPHHGLAQERFFPIGPFAVLPMQGNQSSLVWVEPNERIEAYLELDAAEAEQEIAERIGGYLGEINIIGKRFAYPLSLLHARKYTSERVALIGDAAHGMHPIAGQGVNLGFRDVDVLSKLISKQYALGLDIGAESLLAEYAALRNCDNISMLAATDILNRLFSNNIAPIRLARAMGLWAVGNMPPLKRAFMRHAMGIRA